MVHKYDGIQVQAGNKPTTMKLEHGRINGILKEVGAILEAPEGWAAQPQRVGINCANGFVDFQSTNEPVLLPHDPEFRQRHVLPAEWNGEMTLPSGSLLERLMVGCFKGDGDQHEKIALIGEVAGAAALGYATRLVEPKAVVMLGRTAENGKSQMLDLVRGLLPATAVSAIPPSKFGDQTFVVKLRGKLLNTSDELGTAAVISSDTFKYLVTGEPVSARDLYRSAIDFRCPAQHMYACNQLPGFRGGMDRGVRRRLRVLPFNRTIPIGERVAHIAERVLQDELPAVIGMVVDGAARLLRQQRFTEPWSSAEALEDWAQLADVVLGWAAERLMRDPHGTMTSKEAREDLGMWAFGMGMPLPSINTLTQRLQAAGFVYKRSNHFRGFVGVRRRNAGE
jgi:P4 family phage/plasmid primase-like protien